LQVSSLKKSKISFYGIMGNLNTYSLLGRIGKLWILPINFLFGTILITSGGGKITILII